MMQRLAAALFGLVLAAPAWSDAAPDAMEWLRRVAEAPRKLSYSGTFIYQNGSHTETSRITHVVERGDELERIEVLDGSPRQILRVNDEVKSYLPESRLLVIEQRSAGRQTFPALLPASVAGLAEHYTIRKGAAGRVAGFDSQSILIEPKDQLRYGHQFWVEMRSGIPLKAGLFDQDGEQIESFAFTELHIGGPVDRKALKAQPGVGGGEWKVVNVRTRSGDDDAWHFKTPLPGFRKVIGMRRQMHTGLPEITHLVFSDGLAAFSVFIEPLSGGRTPETGQFAMGTVNIFKRVADGHLLVVMGDLPPASLKTVADGMEKKK